MEVIPMEGEKKWEEKNDKTKYFNSLRWAVLV